jgi:putative DNA primase/helicase
MTIHDDARKLGGEVFAKQIRCPGPGHTRNDRSLVLSASKKSELGYVFTSFAGDGFQICADYIRDKLNLPGFKPGAAYVPPKVREKPEKPVQDNTEGARKIWREAGDIRGTPAEVYLRDDRRLRLDRDLDWHRVFRFHKKCRFEGRNYPAMIALFRDVLTDEPKAIHGIFLTRDGHKIGHAACAIDKLQRREAASSGRWAAY